MADNALQARAAALALLNETMRDLTRFKQKEGPSLRIMQVKYEKVIDAKEDLIRKHFHYGDKSKKELECNEMKEWITPHLDTVNDLIDEVFLLLDAEDDRLKGISTEAEKAAASTAEREKLTSQTVVAKKQSEEDEKLIRDRIEAMLKIVDDDERNSDDDCLLVQAQLEEIDVLLDSQNKSWNTLKALNHSKADELAAVFLSENTLKTHITESRSKAIAFVKKNTTPVVNDDASSVTSDSTSTRSDRQSSALRLQKVNLPSFSGDIRSYARFKGNFQKVVQPQYADETHLIYVLKEQCLKGNAKKVIENVEVMKEIWERLDDKYGHGIDIVNLVLKDVKQVTVDKKDTEQGIVNLVDTIERGLQDLTNIEASSEMANSYTVSLIEKKLPDRILTKWLDQDSLKVGADRFNELITFLKQERKQAQRLMQLRGKEQKDSDPPKKPPANKGGNQFNGFTGGKAGHNNKCLVHPQSDHLTRNCRTFLKKKQSQLWMMKQQWWVMITSNSMLKY